MFTPLKPTISVPEDCEPKTHREMNPSPVALLINPARCKYMLLICIYQKKKKKKQSRKWIKGERLVLFERFVPQKHGFLESALASYLHAWSCLQRQSKIFPQRGISFQQDNVEYWMTPASNQMIDAVLNWFRSQMTKRTLVLFQPHWGLCHQAECPFILTQRVAIVKESSKAVPFRWNLSAEWDEFTITGT